MSDKYKYYRYMTYTEKLWDITGTPWQQCSGSSLVDVRKRVGHDLVENPGMPEMVFLPSEIQAAETRAEIMDQKRTDLLVTLVARTTYKGENFNPGGSLWIESVAYSQLKGHIATRKEQCNGEFKVLIVYSEETHELIMWNDLDVGGIPRSPNYDEKRRKTGNRISRAELKDMKKEDKI